MNMIYCKDCGKPVSDNKYGGLCQSCYKYYKDGGINNPLPEAGRIEYDYRGYVVCHICGKAYKRLGSHVKQFHNMTIEEYKEQFGLCRRTKTTEKSYSNKMSRYALDNDMDKQLITTGKNTRFKKGDNKARKGKQIRLQEKLNSNLQYVKGGK